MIPTYPSIAEHRYVWDMLPWLVNGTLAGPDRERVQTHLQHCERCRLEFAAQGRLHLAMAGDIGVEQMPAAGLQRLRQHIDRLEARDAPADAALRPPHEPSRRPVRRWRPRGWAAATAALILVGALAGALWMQGQRRGAEDRYYTVTAATSVPANAVIRAVFAPSLTLAELQAVLDDAKLTIVAGPTEAGVYSLAMTASQSVAWSLQRLRRQAVVRFAEPIAAASTPVR